ncbi:hypothetical protein MalM14_38230 [Gimesia chilikensis]|nr:hypothetical protein MalM14_38230 [Gimesia chilikensis]
MAARLANLKSRITDTWSLKKHTTALTLFRVFRTFRGSFFETVETITETTEGYSKEPTQFSTDSFPLSATPPDYIRGNP